MSESTREIYDLMGREYRSPEHRTTEFFSNLQEQPLRELILRARERIGKPLADLDVCNVGSGATGNSRLMTGELYGEGATNDRAFDLKKVTFLDISETSLTDFKRDVIEDGMTAGGVFQEGDLGRYVVGNAEQLTKELPGESQDIVFTALCDHIENQEQFYDEARKVLRPGGAFITTYPSAEINRVIREQIYGIDPNTTRFIVGGQAHLIPSKTVTPEELSSMYRQGQFTDIHTSNIVGNPDLQPSETIQKAVTIIGKPIEEISIMVSGIGFKK